MQTVEPLTRTMVLTQVPGKFMFLLTNLNESIAGRVAEETKETGTKPTWWKLFEVETVVLILSSEVVELSRASWFASCHLRRCTRSGKKETYTSFLDS